MRRHGPLLLALALALLLRLPLLLRPGPGRDEATYLYWAWHPELFYAPLLQAMVRMVHLLPLPDLLALRLPSLLGGALVLLLVDRLQRTAGAPARHRTGVLLAVALCEWQTFTGATLHPDTLFSACLLALVLAARGGWSPGVGIAAALAALAKPTGLLLLPVAGALVCLQEPSWRRRGAALAPAAAALGLLLARLEPGMLATLARFGRMDPTAPFALRLGAGGVALLFSAGPLLLLLPLVGARQRWARRHEPGAAGREARAALGLAAVLLGAFTVAALGRGQIKANWILPAALLLLPLEALRWRAWAWRAGLAVAAGCSLALGAASWEPAWLERVESALPSRALDYRLHAGSREAEVSPTRTWAQHLAESDDGGGFSRRVLSLWRDAGGRGRPAWIVSDDYGLSAQLAWGWHDRRVRIVLVGDGLFPRAHRDLERQRPAGGVLLLGVQRKVGTLAVAGLARTGPVRRLPHPVTGRPVEVAPAGFPPASKEGS